MEKDEETSGFVERTEEMPRVYGPTMKGVFVFAPARPANIGPTPEEFLLIDFRE